MVEARFKKIRSSNKTIYRTLKKNMTGDTIRSEHITTTFKFLSEIMIGCEKREWNEMVILPRQK